MKAELFSAEVERIVEETNAEYLDVVMSLCQANDIDPMVVNKLLSPEIMLKITKEAEKKNLLKK